MARLAKQLWLEHVARIAERGYVETDDYAVVGHAGVAYARRLIRELGTRDPGSTANERWANCDAAFEVELLDKREREAERAEGQQAYWAERAHRPDTRYWDVANWPDAQDARTVIECHPGVTRTWVKRTERGYRILWAGPAFLEGDTVAHADTGEAGTVADHKDGYFTVTWADGHRGAYRASELRRP